jgi:hypothetical protein
MTERMRLFQSVRLKGRATIADLAAAAGLTVEETTRSIAELTEAGHVEDARERHKLTAAGRAALEAELADERKGIDQVALLQGYHAFDEHNTALKSLMTRWQLKDESTPNDHTDTAYDAAVLVDLRAVDAAFQPLLQTFVDIAPRLGHYPPRFRTALDRIDAGDHSWFARPLADSYHTVWFELHEELIGLAGLSRAEEAAVGRAE